MGERISLIAAISWFNWDCIYQPDWVILMIPMRCYHKFFLLLEWIIWTRLPAWPFRKTVSVGPEFRDVFFGHVFPCFFLLFRGPLELMSFSLLLSLGFFVGFLCVWFQTPLSRSIVRVAISCKGPERFSFWLEEKHFSPWISWTLLESPVFWA